ncbi:hypothetical protein JCM1840_000763 [Sporobolomyces johnsonii]
MATAALQANLSHLQWRAPEFLLAFGQLSTAQLALDYFALSPFFDKSSSNAQLRMQMLFSRGGMDGVDEEAELRRFVGIEYVVAHAAPPNLWIIHKRNRSSPNEATVLAAYHILNANVYQAPTLYTVLNERVLTSLHALSTSFSSLTALKPAWSPETLYRWDIKPPPVSSAVPPLDSPADLAATADETAAPAKRAREETSELDPIEDASGAKREKGQDVADEDEEERPADAFNPLLFRALQGVARRLAQENAEAAVEGGVNGAAGS